MASSTVAGILRGERGHDGLGEEESKRMRRNSEEFGLAFGMPLECVVMGICENIYVRRKISPSPPLSLPPLFFSFSRHVQPKIGLE